MMPGIFSEGFMSGLASLSSGAGILALLGVLCVWVWTLIILTAVALRDAARGTACTGAAAGQPDDGCPAPTAAGAAGLVAAHAVFCRGLRHGGLSLRLRRRIVRARMDMVLRQVTKNVGTILLLSSLAPLLGLLGTVEGMVGTFRALAEAGSADNAALTGGISKALVTTQGGLLVAIPSLLAGGILYRKSRKLRNALRSVSLRAAEASGRTAPACSGQGDIQ